MSNSQQRFVSLPSDPVADLHALASGKRLRGDSPLAGDPRNPDAVDQAGRGDVDADANLTKMRSISQGALERGAAYNAAYSYGQLRNQDAEVERQHELKSKYVGELQLDAHKFNEAHAAFCAKFIRPIPGFAPLTGADAALRMAEIALAEQLSADALRTRAMAWVKAGDKAMGELYRELISSWLTYKAFLRDKSTGGGDLTDDDLRNIAQGVPGARFPTADDLTTADVLAALDNMLLTPETEASRYASELADDLRSDFQYLIARLIGGSGVIEDIDFTVGLYRSLGVTPIKKPADVKRARELAAIEATITRGVA